MDNLESRIRALEASNRRQRYSITALAAIIVGGAFIAATRPAGDGTFDTVTCKKWKVVDKDGKVRIGAATEPGGASAMLWTDTNGKIRMAAGTDAMSWFDKDGKQRIVASAGDDGMAGITWFDKDGKVRIGAAINAADKVILPTRDLTPKP